MANEQLLRSPKPLKALFSAKKLYYPLIILLHFTRYSMVLLHPAWGLEKQQHHEMSQYLASLLLPLLGFLVQDELKG